MDTLARIAGMEDADLLEFSAIMEVVEEGRYFEVLRNPLSVGFYNN